MDAKKLLNILFDENMEETYPDNYSNYSGESNCELVCSRAVKELLEHSVEVEVFTKIFQIKDEQLKNANDKITELQKKICFYEERINICNQKIKEKDELLTSLSAGSTSIKNTIDNLMDLLKKNQQNNYETDEHKVPIDYLNDEDISEIENISQKETSTELNKLSTNKINKPTKSTINKLEETIKNLSDKVIEKDEKLSDLIKKLDDFENGLRICIPYGTANALMFIPHTPPFKVNVEKYNKLGYIIIQNRTNETYSFKRSLQEYCEGFGKSRDDFWIGLETIHKITNYQPHVLRIQIWDYSEEQYFAEYDNFVVGGKDENYKLKSLGDYKGNAGDMMRFNENKEFQVCPKLGGGGGAKRLKLQIAI
ncbi:angiopoietin-related protein 2-like isoform X1 [Drosophila sulfurigaster albostrigata]|uniref:angiopoietin-related protein 2-like isoform X1 n=1 Tax=Drosophila sulfurigaster albostrigata TaxID=89887 RepID=UPI002D21909D|nr:angiopoietin-related protein 2-like isoform X1 [Drosophila sulfurigaster albostrigata]